jgi:hypothetical protein
MAYQDDIELLTSRGLEFRRPPSAGYAARLAGVARAFPGLTGTPLRQAGRGHAFTREHPGRKLPPPAVRAPEAFAAVRERRELRLPRFIEDLGNRVLQTRGPLRSRRTVVRAVEVLGRSARPAERTGEEPRLIVRVRTRDGREIVLGGKGGVRQSVLRDLLAATRTRRDFLGALRAMHYGRALPGAGEETRYGSEYGADFDLDSIEFTQY